MGNSKNLQGISKGKMTERIVVRKKQAGRERKDGDYNALCACAKRPCPGEDEVGV